MLAVFPDLGAASLTQVIHVGLEDLVRRTQSDECPPPITQPAGAALLAETKVCLRDSREVVPEAFVCARLRYRVRLTEEGRPETGASFGWGITHRLQPWTRNEVSQVVQHLG